MSELILALAVCWFISIQLFNGHIFIDGAIERIELYNESCLSIDPDCSIDRNEKVQLEKNPSHTLNLMLHLLGVTPPIESRLITINRPTQALNTKYTNLPLWEFATHIFHPPIV